ncbi:MAG: TetR/AcrR family transcriptional regulator [Phyllobacteriaceae bacterium]|nr:TetR/AcrR family transcriptional regulator [Phyllobacteriaceae bacterium]
MAMGRPRAFDREAALDRAMEVFWRKGYEGATLAELTRTMGINPPSLYAAFGNKEGLFTAALDRYSARIESYLADILAAPTAREVVSRMLHGKADYLTDPANPPGCLYVQGGLACGDDAKNVPAELARRRARAEVALCERFERAAAEGDHLPPDAVPAVLASLVTTLIQGMDVRASAGATREDLHRLVDLALAGLFPTAAAPNAPLRSSPLEGAA